MLKLITPAAEPAVSLVEFREHLQNNATTEDADLQLKLDAAITHVENETRRCLVTSVWDLYLPAWPCRAYLDMPLGNLQSVASIKYTDSAGAQRTVDAADYKAARTWSVTDETRDAGVGRVYLAYNKLWPSATLDTGEPIVIRFTCGWDAAFIPKPLKHAILMLGAHWYRNRDAVIVGNTAASVSSEMAMGVQRLCSAYEDRHW